MDFTFGYSPWLLLLCVVGAAGLTYWSYRSTIPALSTKWRSLLGALRFVALTLILFLLFEPVYRQFQEVERPPVLAVLVDDSESMQLVTGGADAPSAATARDSLRPVLASLDLPAATGESTYYSFGRGLESQSGPQADSLRFDESRTDIAGALEALREDLQGEHLRGVVLVSDGQYNAGSSPVRTADRFPVPIHTVTVGDTSRRRDVRIRSVATNERAYLNSAVPVRASIASRGGSDTPVTVRLERNGTVLDESEVRLPDGTADVPVDLTYRPDRAGFQQLTVTVSQIEGEATARNNRRTLSIRVLESKRNVLLLGGAPSPNFTALRRVFERDADTDVTARVATQNGSFLGGSLPDDLSTVDVIVCAGFPSTPVPSATVERIASVIEEGTPALFFLDRQTDIEAWSEQFDAALPVSTSSRTVSFREGRFSIVEGERQHPILRLDDGGLDLVNRLPPLQVGHADWSTSPDARVLATATGTTPSESPLLVVRRRAGQRVAAFLGTGVWRWALLPPDLEAASGVWPGLASNLLRWVSTEESGDPVQVEPVASTFDGSETIEFTGQVYDESMQPVADASVDVTVTDSTGTDFPYSMEPVGQGRYALDVGQLPQGTYDYEATARLDETELGTDRGQFSVARQRLEYQSPRADPVLLRQIATRSGGRSFVPSTVDRLPEQLANSSAFASEVTQRTSEAELWRTWIFLVIILLLLAGEWTLRKRLGLA